MGRSRLTALILALAVSAVAILAAGCGSSDSTTGGERRWRNADRRLRRPLPAVRGIRPDEDRIHGLRRRADGSDRRKDRARTRIHRHLLRHDLRRPRPGQIRSGRLGDDDHRRTRRNGQLHRSVLPGRTGDPGQRPGADRLGGRTERSDGRRPEGNDRRGIRRRKSRSGRTPHLSAGPGRGQRAEVRRRRSGRDRHPGGRKRGQEHERASKSPRRSRPKKNMESRSPRTTKRCSKN